MIYATGFSGTPSSVAKAASIALAILLAAGAAVASPQGQSTSRAHVEHLAADDLGGRLTGTPDAQRAADYIVSQLQAMGAQPLPGQQDFRLPFEFTSGVTDAGSHMAASGTGLPSAVRSAAGQIQALAFSDTEAVSGPLVFAGYGITVPDSEEYVYDNFATLDIEGKVVMVLRYIPEDADQETRARLGQYSALRRKAMRARELGAVGMLVVTGPRSPNAGELIDIAFDRGHPGRARRRQPERCRFRFPRRRGGSRGRGGAPAQHRLQRRRLSATFGCGGAHHGQAVRHARGAL